MDVALIPPLEKPLLPWACPQCRGRAQARAAFIERFATLSQREREVTLGIAMGESPALLSKRLFISVKTVSTYRSRVIEKLGLDSNAEIAVACERAGLLENWAPGDGIVPSV